MKKLVSVLFLFYCFAGFAQNIPNRPNPPKLVNDLANILTSDQKESLERKLVSYDDSTSTQIAIITVSTTGDYDIHDYALKILRDWGVGNKNNNGIVIVAAIEDHKIRIETGYGMEGVIPDITAQQIIDNQITPNFRAGNYYRGFDEAVDAIIRAAAGEYRAPENYNRRTTGRKSGSGLSFLIPLIILIIIISKIGGGRGGGGMMSRRGFNPFLGSILGGMIGGSLGRGGGWSSDSGGGGWSGGGGGGFGGFGGGSGGGGGASGSW